MNKNLKSILNLINKLEHKELHLYFSLNSYQIEILAKLNKERNLNAQSLLKSEIKFSKAQKYRYIHKLISKKLISKSYNCYNLRLI